MNIGPCPRRAHPEGGTGRGQGGEEKLKPVACQDQVPAAGPGRSLDITVLTSWLALIVLLTARSTVSHLNSLLKAEEWRQLIGSRLKETGDLPTAQQPGTLPPTSSLGVSFLSYIKTSNFCLTTMPMRRS